MYVLGIRNLASSLCRSPLVEFAMCYGGICYMNWLDYGLINLKPGVVQCNVNRSFSTSCLHKEKGCKMKSVHNCNLKVVILSHAIYQNKKIKKWKNKRKIVKILYYRKLSTLWIHLRRRWLLYSMEVILKCLPLLCRLIQRFFFFIYIYRVCEKSSYFS